MSATQPVGWDAPAAEKFAEYLHQAGPDETGRLTEEHLVYRIEILQDSWWLEFLMIDDREAALSLARYRSQLWKLRNPDVPKPRKRSA